MYIIQKCAISIDGYIDDASPDRLILSNEEDFAYVDQVRADCDAILVGAGTIRADNPKLRIRDSQLQERRLSQGKPVHPTKVTLTMSGNIPENAAFFSQDGSEKIVYVTDAVQDRVRDILGAKAEIVSVKEESVALAGMLEDLERRGIRRLLVEGGSFIHTQFLVQGLADELQISIAPFFVNDHAAPRFVRPSAIPYTRDLPMHLDAIRKFGSILLLKYLLPKKSS